MRVETHEREINMFYLVDCSSMTGEKEHLKWLVLKVIRPISLYSNTFREFCVSDINILDKRDI